MAKMRAVQVARAGGPLELVEREVPEPARGEVRVRIEACGLCHSDSLTVEGQWPGLTFPRIPSHEIAGVIEGRLCGYEPEQRRLTKFRNKGCSHATRPTVINHYQRPQDQDRARAADLAAKA
jgi:hypothetical protein